MPLILNPTTGEILFTEDPRALYEQGYRDPTVDELEQYARREEFGTFEQQLQAQGERIVRGATLGAVTGFGDEESNRARAEVSEELSPVTSAVAGIVPDVALSALSGGLAGLATGAGRAAAGAAIGEGAGLLRAGLAAGRAGGLGALAAESAAGGLVGAGQQAYARGQYLGEDPGTDAENVLLWGGIGFGLGAAAQRFGRVAGEAAEDAGEHLDDIAKRAETETVAGAGPSVREAQSITPDAAVSPSPVDLTGKSLRDLGALDDPTTFKPETLEALRTGKGGRNDFARDFGASGRVDQTGQLEQGIQVEMRPGGPRLVDGRHRVMVGREKGLSEVYGQVYEGARAPGKKPIYEGMIPISASEKRLVEREAADAGLQRALGNASKADADDIVDAAVRAPEPEPSSFGRKRRLYQNREAVLGAAEREMQQDVGGLFKDLRQVLDRKGTQVASDVSDNLDAQRVAVNGVAQDAAKLAGELRGEARAYGAASGKKGLQYAIKGAKDWNLALMDHAKQLEKATSGKGLFEALDEFKRVAQDFKLSLEKGAANSTNPIHHQQLIPRIDMFERKVRAVLEDENVWGKAGAKQRALNAVISDRVIPQMRGFEEAVLRRTSQGYDAVWNMEGWETKIRGLLKGADPGRRRAVVGLLDGVEELASVQRQFGGGDVAARLEAQAAKIRRTLGLADEVADASGRMEALGNLVGGGGPLSGALAGGLMAGPAGAAVGAVMPGIVRRFVMGDLMGDLNRLMGATDEAVGRSVDDWIRSSRVRGSGLRSKLPKLPEISNEARQLRDVAARRGVSQELALFMGEHGTALAAFEATRDALLNDETFFDSVSSDYGDVAVQAPELYGVLAGRVALARNFLIQRMPPNVSVSVARPNGYPPSRDSIEDWAQYVNAVRYPRRVGKNIAAMTQQQAETLRTVYPRYHEQLQQSVLEGIARAQTSGEPMDDRALMRISVLFPDLDSVASPIFGHEFGDAMRTYYEGQKQMKAKRSGAISAAPKRPQSPLDATMQSGATFGQGMA